MKTGYEIDELTAMPVGSTFEYAGYVITIVAQKEFEDGCIQCCFLNNRECIIANCIFHIRNDETNVYFKKL